MKYVAEARTRRPDDRNGSYLKIGDGEEFTKKRRIYRRI